MKNPLIIFFIILTSYTAFSQEREGMVIARDFTTEQEQYNFLSNFNYNQLNLNDNASIINQQNAVFIQQIGNFNQVISQTQSQSSNLELMQNGDFNNITLKVNAPDINARVIQNGDNNSVLDYIYYSNLDVKLNAVQNGNNLTINRIGVNSLSNKLQLVQEGSFKTITVISN
jgi:hypothetical protein